MSQSARGKRVVASVVLLLISTDYTVSQLHCAPGSLCTCRHLPGSTKENVPSTEINCPSLNITVSEDSDNRTNILITCLESGHDASVYSSLSGLSVGFHNTPYTAEIKDCPLPHSFVGDVLIKVGGERVRSLKFIHSSTNGKSVTLRRYTLEKLKDLEELELNCYEQPLQMLPEYLLEDLTKLSSLTIYALRFEFSYIPDSLFLKNLVLQKITFKTYNEFLKPLAFPKRFLSNMTLLRIVIFKLCGFKSLESDLLANSTGIWVLSFRYNLIASVENDTFKNLKNLQKLDLSYNQIASLPHGVFNDTKNLKELYLSGNKLRTLESHLFYQTVNLRRLHLGSNQFREFPNDLCYHLNNLESLDLSSNRLQSLLQDYRTSDFDYSTLHRCKKLKWLNLEDNRLTEIYEDWRLEMHELETLQLSNNSFTHVEIQDLNFDHTLDITLSKNNIKWVSIYKIYYLSRSVRNEKLAEILSGTEGTGILNNPFNCSDCANYYLAKVMNELNRDGVMINEERNYFKYLQCETPSSSKGKLLTDTNTYNHTLNCVSYHNMSEQSKCPPGCSCRYRAETRGHIISCQDSELQDAPRSLPLLEREPADHTELNIYRNRLQSFTVPDDSGYKNVTHFNLSNNNISTITTAYFSPIIKKLDLSVNSLTGLSEDTLHFLTHAKGLARLELHGNPWHCDCEGLPLILLVQEKRKKNLMIHEVFCSDRRSMESLAEIDVCPDILRIVLYGVGIIFAALVFITSVLTTLYYKYKTQIHIYCFSSRYKFLRWIVSHPDVYDDRKYDAFITFSQDDELFVAENLVPVLEETGNTKYKLCLHYRDWMPGDRIVDQIYSSVRSSRRTMVILSPSFLESVWGVAEFRVAHAEAMREGVARVIMVLYKDVGPLEDLQCEDIKAYLQTTTYLQWEAPTFWSQLTYALPHPPESGDNNALLRCCCVRQENRRSSQELVEHFDTNDILA